jgi:hypothetical protein
MVPDYRSSKFTPTNVIHSYNLRHRSDSIKFLVPRPLIESLKKRFTYRGTVLWNSLPVEAVNATTVVNFKNITKDNPNFLLLVFSIVILRCNLL